MITVYFMIGFVIVKPFDTYWPESRVVTGYDTMRECQHDLKNYKSGLILRQPGLQYACVKLRVPKRER